MPIVGTDQRRVVDRFDVPGQITKAPLPSITAIDTRFDSATTAIPPGIGTGVVISPNYVLTAAHNLFVKGDIFQYFTDIRVTSSNQQKDLDGRAIRGTNLVDTGNVDLNVDPTVNPLDDPINTIPPGLFLPFPEQFVPAPADSRPENQVDIGLIKVNNRGLISDAPPIGLIAFVDPLTLESSFPLPIQTAGYPADNVANSFPSRNSNNNGIPDQNDKNIRPRTELDGLVSSLQVRGRDLVLAPGILDANGNETTGRVERASEGEGERRIQYSTNIDTVSGQSGSPVWGFLPEEDGLELEPIPRVFAVHSRGISAGINAANFGTLIDKEAYDLIIDEIEGDGDPDLLPENAIIGSNPRVEVTPPNDGNDLINGTYRKELILGLGGDDTIFGAGADDRLEGNEGDDQLDGGTGDDILTGGRGDDIIDGGTNTLAIINPFNRENDVAVYSANRSEYSIDTQTIGGIGIIGIGEETVTTVTHLNNGIDGIDTLTNIEILQFADGAIPLSSDDGIIDGLLNFFGGSANDNIVGNILANVLRGEGGNDFLSGRDGNDTLKGNDGNDKLFGEGENDLLQGFIGSDILEGGGGNDRLYGNEGSDIFRGGSGNDILSGGAGFGRDKLKGQDGNDSIAGGGGDDLLQGGKNDDLLFGNGNNDILFGDEGNDRLDGGSGQDTLSGGAGQDEFVFVSSSQSQDEITDFTIQDDTLLFKANQFAGISTLGMISSDMLTIGSSANDSSDRFIYNAGTGDLFYDSDGTGNSQQTKLAKLDAGLALTRSDFSMF